MGLSWFVSLETLGQLGWWRWCCRLAGTLAGCGWKDGITTSISSQAPVGLPALTPQHNAVLPRLCCHTDYTLEISGVSSWKKAKILSFPTESIVGPNNVEFQETRSVLKRGPVAFANFPVFYPRLRLGKRPSSSESLKSQLHIVSDFRKEQFPPLDGCIQHVYGAQHPPFDPLLHGTLIKPGSKPPTTPVKLKKVSTFQEFESNTSDAWDLGDDDDELLAIAAENLNTEVVMETAHKVIQNHSKLQEQHKFQEEHLQEEKQVESAELTSITYVDNRLVKSVSEGHTSSSSDNASESSSMQRSQSLPQTCTPPLVSGMADCNASVTPALTEREASRLDKFKQLLAGPNTDLEELRKLSWSGIPKRVRPIAWKLLSGYLPANVDRRESTLKRKRKEYFAFVEQYYDSRNDENHQDTYRQIHIDIPRMSPEVLRLQPKVTEIFERILFIWAIRHPASGYVQGINDLVTPFFVVFVCEYIEEEEVENFDVSSLPEEVLQNIEADSYWCMSKLLDGIQDNYTFAQPGIQKKVKMLEELVSRIDEQVHRHLDQHEVKYLQFAFRWMNNLLMREVPLHCTIRLWDTYQSEPEGFSHFHLYVCAAFLVRWRKEILEEKDFQELLIFLQNLPTVHWGDEEISVLLAEAYRLKFAFADAPNHYKK
ncbi:TBC1 domain family, member 22A [Columba livia]|uniref:TBC1 domain family, member 22A n=1 Tax=Columba livia TaxID=8932 RepID=A0A2I0MH99_COLLI|nr:TBC1 domain family, member 22A [Columba livia]